MDLPAEGQSPAAILGELLRAFGRQDSLDHFAAVVVEVLVRGLQLEGALLLLREGELLRVAAAAGAGVDLGAIPPVGLDAHAWPEPGPSPSRCHRTRSRGSSPPPRSGGARFTVSRWGPVGRCGAR